MTNTGAEMADQLEKLASLHGSGALSDTEFEAAKARVLGTAPAGPAHSQSTSFGPPLAPWPAPAPVKVGPSPAPPSPRRRKHLTWTPFKSKLLAVLVLVLAVALGGGGYQSLSASLNGTAANLTTAAIVALVVAGVLVLWILFFIVSLPIRVACMRGASEGALMAIRLAIFLGIWVGGIGWAVAIGVALFAPPKQFDWYVVRR
jgi:hypothetical protein